MDLAQLQLGETHLAMVLVAATVSEQHQLGAIHSTQSVLATAFVAN